MGGTRPLEGIRVADFSWFGAGPIAGQTLANFGAEVIRVESETHPDGLRATQPVPLGKEGPDAGLNVSGYYNNFNANKLSFALNMNHPMARDVALRLVAKCDVLLENYTPRVMRKWGLAYEDVLKVRPDIIYASQPMQGTWGPHKDFLGFGGVLAPVSGFSYLSGWPDRPPVGLGTNYPDYVINPGHTTVAILAALRHRQRTGEGQYLELAQLESTASGLGVFLMDYANNGRIAERNGNRTAHAAPHGAFRCDGEDRWIAIAVFDDRQWQALVATMDSPDWALEPRFSTFVGRKANEDDLERHIEAWTATREAFALADRLQDAGVPAGVVQTARDVLENDAHLHARGFYRYLDHPEAGRTAYDGTHFRLHDTPGGPDRPAPLLGQHTEYVVKQLLGMSDEEVAELLINEVLR